MKLKKDLLLSTLIKILYLSIMAFGTIEIIASGLSLSYSQPVFLFFLICFCILININIKHFKIAVTILFLLLLFIFKADIVTGFQIIANEIGSLLAEYYGIHLKAFNFMPESGGATASFVFCAAVLAALTANHHGGYFYPGRCWLLPLCLSERYLQPGHYSFIWPAALGRGRHLGHLKIRHYITK